MRSRDTRERWQEVKQVLEEALALTPDERHAYLQTVCADDVSLGEEVESFLKVTTESFEEFLETPAVGRPPPVPDDALQTTGTLSTGAHDEVCPLDLAPYTKLRIATRTSEYHITVVAPLDLEVIVQGGRRFPLPTRARFRRQDVIAVGQALRLQVGLRKVVTTQVVAIDVLD